MKNLIFLITILTFFSCSSDSEKSKTYSWIQQMNETKLEEMDQLFLQLGSRNSDKLVLDQSKEFIDTLNKLIDGADKLTEQEIDDSLQPFLDARFPTMGNYEIHGNYETFKTWNITNSISETRTQLALLGFEVLSLYEQNMRMQEIIFDQIQVLFLPDDIIVPEGERLKGKYVIAATVNAVSDGTSLLVDGDSIPFIEGEGIIDIPWSKLKYRNKLDAVLNVKIDEFKGELKYKTIPNNR